MKNLPLFIIGMPRSGTKLLRELLNNHTKISILTIETEFLPYWVKNWGTWGGAERLSDYKYFDRFYKKVIRLPYFLYKSSRGDLINPRDWYNRCGSFSVSGVFEALVRHDANVGKSMIWGDKSPAYIRQIPLIKKLFPEAKIIHIIRDVRDYCLSINNVWGKNMMRAAQRWADDVAKARSDGALFKEDCIELKYEDLLDNPEIILMRLCEFLGVEYEDQMLEFKNPTENYGDARDKKEVVSSNKRKWEKKLDKKMVLNIEMICSSQLRALGYPISYRGPNRRLGKLYLLYLKAFDGINLMKNDKDWKEPIKRLKYHFRHAKSQVR